MDEEVDADVDVDVDSDGDGDRDWSDGCRRRGAFLQCPSSPSFNPYCLLVIGSG